MRQFAKLFEQVDVIVTPSTDEQLIATNLTGNPAVILPNGLRGADAPAAARNRRRQPRRHRRAGHAGIAHVSSARLYQDAKLAAFSHAYQEATGFHKLHPKLD